MLFDLEDYATSRIIGQRGNIPLRTANNILWDDPETTFRATRDAYAKAVNEYYLAAAASSTAAERHQLDIDFLAYLDSFANMGAKSII